MKMVQVARVFELIRTRTGKAAPYRVGILMTSGHRFAGSAQPVDAGGLVELLVDRIADAHLTKPPEVIWLDVEAILAVTDEGIFVPPPAVVAQERQAGETAALVTETPVGHEDHEPKV